MQGNDRLAILTHWCHHGLIRAVDLAIAKFLHQQDPEGHGDVLLAAALASYQYGRGHTCLDLQDFLSEPATFLEPPKDVASRPPMVGLTPMEVAHALDQSAWLSILESSPLVGMANPTAPLVLDGDRLYLTRNWDHEQRIATEILARLTDFPSESADLAETLRILFPVEASTQDTDSIQPLNWQKISGALASEGRFLILTGGPGTGKTYTVARILALLQKEHPQRILLAAPTGKAAARLSESIADAMTSIPEILRQQTPGKAITIHQMLGASRQGRGYRHDVDTKLEADVVVIDEASMIDLEMMAAILRALPVKTRLILVGDKDQLASVEAGSVLGDLCRDVETRGYVESTCERIRHLCDEAISPVHPETTDPLAQRTVMLRYSKRFDENSGIGVLAHAINQGDSNRVLELLKAPPAPHDIQSFTLRKEPTPSTFRRFVLGESDAQFDESASTIEGFVHYLNAIQNTRPSATDGDDAYTRWSQNILEVYARYQILCAVRSGPFGIIHLNELVEVLLASAGLINQNGAWYEGRPVMMTRNDYELGIMNGDVGITLAFPPRNGDESVLKVAFRNSDGSMKFVLPSRLSEAETVYAMTIHKSQGSEFEHAVLVLPEPRETPIMSRELIYTGVTRAKKRLTLIAPNLPELAHCVERRIRRSGRLSDLLKTDQSPSA